MWELDSAISEVIIRSFVIYLGLFIMFRFLGKKQLGEMSPFDFVLLLIISEAVSNGLVGDEHSLTGALISAATLLLISYIIDYLAFKSKKFEDIVEGRAQVIIEDGKVIRAVQEKEKITMDELIETMHEHGIEKFEQVKFAVVGTNGKISFIQKI